jgi:uncharacterized lipoprotein YmbA
LQLHVLQPIAGFHNLALSVRICGLLLLVVQVRYFKSLPSLMADVKAVAAQMSSAGDLPSSERLHTEAQAAKDGLTAAVGHRHSTRKQHAAMVAAT